MPGDSSPIAVLTSGGLDSAVLLAELARAHAAVFPLYVRAGHYWEPAERYHLDQFLSELHHPAVRPLVVLELPVADLYGKHWSLTGESVPDAASPDSAVYLPGRNLLIASKALVWCHLNDVPTLAVGTLKGNPFPDADQAFFDDLSRVTNRALTGNLRIVRPFAHMHKREVLARGRDLPLRWTFSCIQPVDTLHCGQCNKCAERHRAFVEQGWDDPTEYSLFLRNGDDVPHHA